MSLLLLSLSVSGIRFGNQNQSREEFANKSKKMDVLIVLG